MGVQCPPGRKTLAAKGASYDARYVNSSTGVPLLRRRPRLPHRYRGQPPWPEKAPHEDDQPQWREAATNVTSQRREERACTLAHRFREEDNVEVLWTKPPSD